MGKEVRKLEKPDGQRDEDAKSEGEEQRDCHWCGPLYRAHTFREGVDQVSARVHLVRVQCACACGCPVVAQVIVRVVVGSTNSHQLYGAA